MKSQQVAWRGHECGRHGVRLDDEKKNICTSCKSRCIWGHELRPTGGAIGIHRTKSELHFRNTLERIGVVGPPIGGLGFV